MRQIVWSLTAAATLLTAACATAAGLRQEPLDRGVERQFEAPFSEVLSAARDGVREAGISIESAAEVSDGVWVIVGQKDASMWSYGELVRVVVQKAASDVTTVRVLTKRRLATNITADDDHSDSIFGAISLALEGAQ